MKTKAILKAGFVGGLAQGISLHLLVYLLLYQEAYNFTLPAFLFSAINWLAVIAFVVSFFGTGAYAIWLAGESVTRDRQAWIGGATSGLLAGVLIYLLVGALSSVLIWGVVPSIDYLYDPAKLAGADAEKILEGSVQSAIVGVYMMILGILLFDRANGWRRGGGLFLVPQVA